MSHGGAAAQSSKRGPPDPTEPPIDPSVEPDPYLESEDAFPHDPDLPDPNPNNEPVDPAQFPRIINGPQCNLPTSVYIATDLAPN